MMPSIMDALAGMRLLLAGDDRAAVSALRSAVGSAGAVAAACTGDPTDVVAVVAADPPAAVVAIGGNAASLRKPLDPLALDMGPEVLAVEDLVDAGRIFDGDAAARLRGARRAPRAARAADRARGRRRRARRWRGGGTTNRRALDTLRRLALAAEYRDDNTHEHTQRVGELAARLARTSATRTGRSG